jgi:hypothetical protein
LGDLTSRGGGWWHWILQFGLRNHDAGVSREAHVYLSATWALYIRSYHHSSFQHGHSSAGPSHRRILSTLIPASQQASRRRWDLLRAQSSSHLVAGPSTNHGCSSVMVGRDTTISDESEKRPQNSYAPIRNPIYPPDVLEPLRRQAARVLYLLSRDPAIAANLTHKAISLAQAYDAQHRHEVLGPSK